MVPKPSCVKFKSGGNFFIRWWLWILFTTFYYQLLPFKLRIGDHDLFRHLRKGIKQQITEVFAEMFVHRHQIHAFSLTEMRTFLSRLMCRSSQQEAFRTPNWITHSLLAAATERWNLQTRPWRLWKMQIKSCKNIFCKQVENRGASTGPVDDPELKVFFLKTVGDETTWSLSATLTLYIYTTNTSSS